MLLLYTENISKRLSRPDCRARKLPEYFDVFLTVHRSIDLFQITNLMHNSFIL